MLDLVQWNAPGHGRESVAVGKRIWTSGDFIQMYPFIILVIFLEI